MTHVHVTTIDDAIYFSDGSSLSSHHGQDCCEHHYLDFSGLSASDFDGLTFALSGDFFERVPDYGIRLKPINGHPVSIPGYGYNNGYYSNNLDLVLTKPNGEEQYFDITECQEEQGA